MTALNTEHVQWCRSTFASLRLGGEWGVPRSGLVFRKLSEQPDVLVLEAAWPDVAGEDWRAHQRDDLAAIREHFTAAGIEVRGEVPSADQVGGAQPPFDGQTRRRR